MKVNRFNLFRWIAIILIVASLILLVIQLIRFSRLRAGFSPGTRIAGIAVGGLDQRAAAERINQAFNTPIEVKYRDQFFQVKPSLLGFELDMTAMIAAADQQRVMLPFWASFWDYLWNTPFELNDTPLQANTDENSIHSYLLNEVAARYDILPGMSIPIPGTEIFQPGESGMVLDVEKSVPIVERAMQSATNRSVELIVESVAPKRPSLNNLEVLLKQIIDRSKFDGLTEVYILDLEKRDELNFAYENGIDYNPGIAFTAASTMKIPIMVSVFRRINEPTPQGAADLMEKMIVLSDNPAADQLMDIYITPNTGPLLITQDLKEIGLENTFFAGLFEPGAPLLQRFSTPANQRFDYTTDPDVYNQTTTAELGMMLDDIYQCAQTGGGTLAAVFGDDVTQSECQLIISYLTRNKIAALLEAGLPDGTSFGHKHGWTIYNGIMYSAIDAGIVFAPDGDYIAVIAMYQPTQLIYGIANPLAAQISSAIYNYFNIY